MGDGTILYTGGFELPDKNAAALRVLGNAKALRALGYHVVLLGVSKDDNGSQGLVASGGQVEGFDTWHIRYPDNIRQWVSYLQSIDGLKAVCRDCGDVQTVICYNYPSMGLMKAKSFCHVNRIRLIADTTEWYPMADVKWSHKLIKGVDTWWRMRILQKRLDGLIVISSYLQRYYGKCSNVILVPPLIDRSDQKWQVHAENGEADGHRGGDCPIQLICSGGTLGGKNKDTINNLLEALTHFQKGVFSLHVVGMTQADYLKDFPSHRQLLQTLGEAVEFSGKLSHRASLEQVRRADFSILLRDSSRKNNAGFPTKFVESLACGIPAIATDTSDIGKYLQEGRNGFWTRNTPEALLETLQRIAKLNPEALGQMKEACRSMTAFDYRQYMPGLDGLMERIARTTGG